MVMITLFYSGIYTPWKSTVDMLRDTFFSAKNTILIYKLTSIELGNIYLW